jgi:hypothetical protein
MGAAWKRLPLPIIPVLLGALGPALRAQQAAPPDTTPFKRGQWALQFGGGVYFGSLGALKFTSPRSAWLIDFQFNGGHSREQYLVRPDSVVDAITSTARFTSRLGRRAYQPHQVVASYETVGILGGLAHDCFGGSAFPGSAHCSNGWTAGAFADVGAVYLVTPHFSLGGAVGISFAYSRTTTRSPGQGSVSSWSYTGSLGALSLNTTLYF